MDCPVCRVPLVVVEREGIELDWCIDCHGLWFDEGELSLLGEKAGRRLEVEELGRAPDAGAAVGPRRCPRCGNGMREIDLKAGGGEPLRVDRCDEHGLWLDRGELGRIVGSAAPRSAGDESLMLSFLGETFAARPGGEQEPSPSERRSP